RFSVHHAPPTRLCPLSLHDALPAPHDAAQGMTTVPARRLAAISPAHGPKHRLPGFGVTHRIGRAIIKSHNNVGPQHLLNLDRLFRRQKMAASVEMGLKGHSLLG